MRRGFWLGIALLALCLPVRAAATRVALTPGDRLQIQVAGEPELSKEYMVDQAGQITLEMVGPVRAGGLTPDEFQAELTRRLSRYIRTPSVKIQAFQRVAVAGGVRVPGMYDFPKDQPIRLMDALAKAGGFAERARKTRVLLVRQGSPQAEPKSTLVNVELFLKKGKMEQNPALEANDVIYVDAKDAPTARRGLGGLLEVALPLLGALLGS
jgi:protein involved in polysaccharide export with SLBB domain